MNGTRFGSDLIDRYIYQVSKRLPISGRAEIEKELRANISDMLEARCGGRAPAPEDVEAVLLELGPPGTLAGRYREHPRRLIGPELFDIYWLVLRIVLAAVALGLTVSTAIDAVQSAAAGTSGAVALFTRAVTELAIQCVNAAAIAFGWVTAVFAAMEHFGVRIETDKDFLRSLPPVPQGKARIPRSDSIVALVFITLFALLFTLAPQWLGLILVVEGRVVSLLNEDVVSRLLPLILACFALMAAPHVMRLVEGRYTRQLCVVTVAANLMLLVLAFAVLRQPILRWDAVQAALRANAPQSLQALAQEFYAMGVTLPMLVLGVGCFFECLSVVYKTLRYAR